MIVYRGDGAESAAPFGFCTRADGDDGMCAALTHELDRRRPHAAGAGMDEGKSTRREVAECEEIEECGEEGLRNAGTLLIRDVRRKGDGHSCREGHELGVAAAKQERTHAVPLRPAGHAFTPSDYLAGHLHAKRGGRTGRQRVTTLTLGQIQPVQRRGMDAYHELAGSGDWIGSSPSRRTSGPPGLSITIARMSFLLHRMHSQRRPLKRHERDLLYVQQALIGQLQGRYDRQGQEAERHEWILQLAAELGRRNVQCVKAFDHLVDGQGSSNPAIGKGSSARTFPPATATTPPPHAVTCWAATCMSSSFMPTTTRLCASCATDEARAPRCRPNPFNKPRPIDPFPPCRSITATLAIPHAGSATR